MLAPLYYKSVPPSYDGPKLRSKKRTVPTALPSLLVSCRHVSVANGRANYRQAEEVSPASEVRDRLVPFLDKRLLNRVERALTLSVRLEYNSPTVRAQR